MPRLGRWTWLLALGPLLVLGGLLRHLPLGAPVVEQVRWVLALGVELAFLLDGLSLTLAVLVLAIGAAVVAYASGYLAGDARLGRFLGVLLAFMAAMLGLVLSDGLVAMFVFWELTSVTSFLLVGFHHEREDARKAARTALLVTGAGGLALLVAVLGIVAASGVGRWSELAQVDLRGHALYPLVLGALLVGAFTKSAQVPLHFWLPGAMAAPTPVSSYLHSATMVKAGVFLLARALPHLGGTPLWTWTVTSFGALTMVVAAILALAQHDLKPILAFSTVSVLGTLTMLLGAGTEAAVEVAVVFLVAHALYKAALFMVAGNLDHETGTRDVRALGGLRAALPLTFAAGLLAALSKAGAPPLFGFVGKELLYVAKLDHPASWLVVAAVLANVALVATALQVGLRPFVGPRRDTPRPPHEAPATMLVGPLALSLAGVFVGLVPGVFDALFGGPMASAILGRPVEMKLALWHGLNPEALAVLALSALTLVAGAAVWWSLRRTLGPLGHAAAQAARLGPARAFDRAYPAVLRLGGRVTALLQTGRLRRDLALIVVAGVGLVGVVLAPASFRLAPAAWRVQPHEVGLVILVLGGALVSVVSRSRMAAIAGLGVSGVGVAVLFAVFGAPDLAVTQVMVETVTVVLFVLVFHHLPPFARLSGRLDRVRDALIAVAAGAVVTLLALATAGIRPELDAVRFFARASVPEAYGRNVVNVILVDFRALDKLGEITAVALAGVGVAGLLALRGGVEAPPQEPRVARGSLILRTASPFLVVLLVVFSVFALLRGHDEPGGGFVGGLLVAGAFALHALAFGPTATRRLLRIHPRTLLALGLLVALAAALSGLVAGEPLLAGLWMSVPVPGVGKLGTPLLFDVGVYLVVLGATLAILLPLAEEAP